MTRSLFRTFAVLYQITPGDGAGGGQGAGSGAPAGSPATTSPAVPAGGGQPTGAGGAGAPAGTGGVPATQQQYSFPEDRSDWIPRYRYEPLAKAAQRAQQLERDLQTQQQRFAAAMGINPGRQRDPEAERVRNALMEVLGPDAAALFDPKTVQAIQQLRQLQESGQIGELTGLRDSYWNRHATNAARTAVAEYAKHAGIDPKALPPNTMIRMARLLQLHIEEDQTGQRQYRFENDDPSLMEEFMQEITGMFIAPQRAAASRVTAQQVQTNRALPDTTGGGNIPGNGAGAAGDPPQKLRGKDLRDAARNFVLANR